MLAVLTCIRDQHDLLLLVLAGLVCGLSCWAAARLMRGGESEAAPRGNILLAALAAGCGIWTTHFIAMLGYANPLPITFMPLRTVASALLILAVAWLAFSFYARSAHAGPRALAGGLFGLGVGAMHYLGIAAMVLPGALQFDPVLVTASLLLGAALFAAGFCIHPAGSAAGSSPGQAGIAWMAGLMCLGTLALHLTGMGSITILPFGGQVQPDLSGLQRGDLGLVVGLTSLALLSVTGYALLRHRLRLALLQKAERERFRGLADATFEGIAICDTKLVIQDLNTHLEELLGSAAEAARGQPLEDVLHITSGEAVAEALRTAQAVAVPAELRPEGAERVPVELRARRLETASGVRIVAVMRDLRDRIAAEAQMRHMAHHDGLTGVANRTALQQHLEHAVKGRRRGDGAFALLCLDLDHFKDVNDIHGHATGDALLRAVTARCQEEMRPADIIARLGGDEFVIIQVGVRSAEQAASLARRLVAKLSRPFDLAPGVQATISASVGVALCPEHGDQPERLMGQADLALYQVKRDGRNGFALYNPAMDAEVREARSLQADLRQALKKGEFHLFYQPQVDAMTSETTGFEALLRWVHPVRGNVPPSVFIPIAESSGLIHEIGAWVRVTACTEAALWEKPLRISINSSSAELRRPDYVASLGECLKLTGLDPARLEIEVTESLLLEEGGPAIPNLHAVRAMGVQVAMDDFGTGYSSLSTLRAFPFTRIKIDRSFVHDLDSNEQALAIVRAVLGLGRGLNIPVVAEGVETLQQLAILNAEQCGAVQGYLHGRPAPIETYRDLVQEARSEEALAGD